MNQTTKTVSHSVTAGNAVQRPHRLTIRLAPAHAARLRSLATKAGRSPEEMIVQAIRADLAPQ